jgi:hypothetical protein
MVADQAGDERPAPDRQRLRANLAVQLVGDRAHVRLEIGQQLAHPC